MKKIFLTLVVCLMTMVGFGQKVMITVDKTQFFTHSISVNTSYAGEHNLLNYEEGGIIDTTDYIFDLDNKELRQMTRLGDFDRTFKILEVHESDNLVSVITQGDDAEYLCVLGTQKTDGKYVLIIEKIVGFTVEGWFHPEPIVSILKP